MINRPCSTAATARPHRRLERLAGGNLRIEPHVVLRLTRQHQRYPVVHWRDRRRRQHRAALHHFAVVRLTRLFLQGLTAISLSQQHRSFEVLVSGVFGEPDAKQGSLKLDPFDSTLLLAVLGDDDAVAG